MRVHSLFKILTVLSVTIVLIAFTSGVQAAPAETGTNEEQTTTADFDFPAPKGNSDDPWWHPRSGMSFRIQYDGDIDTSRTVDAYDLDLFETSASLIRKLHARGIKVICYFSAGTLEKWRPDIDGIQSSLPSLVGGPTGWRGEKWLDIRDLKHLMPFIKKRMELAAKKGCDAVDPDNVDAFENKNHFALSYMDQIKFNKMVAGLGHEAGLAVGLKNDATQVADLSDLFDFEVSEQCFEQSTCRSYNTFIDQNKPVFDIEYNLRTEEFCPQAAKLDFTAMKKNIKLDEWAEICPSADKD